MIETLTLITLSVLFLIFFRPGKVEPLKNPLFINRVGQFNAVLAPMLNLAQPLLESVSSRFAEADRKIGDTAPLYFSVQDKNVKVGDGNTYLLAATLRGGVLYFQATAPQQDVNPVETLRAFSQTELEKYPPAGTASATAEAALATTIQAAAGERGITVTPL